MKPAAVLAPLAAAMLFASPLSLSQNRPDSNPSSQSQNRPDSNPLVNASRLDEATFGQLIAANGGADFARLVAPYDPPQAHGARAPHSLSGPRYSCLEAGFASACREYLDQLIAVQRRAAPAAR